MEQLTIKQTYLLPANSQALNKAVAVLKSLGLEYEGSYTISSGNATLQQLSIAVPAFPVIHFLDLIEERNKLITKAKERAARPSHTEVQSYLYGDDIVKAYPHELFSSEKQKELYLSIADIVVREYIVQYFSEKCISIQNITLNIPTNRIITAARYSVNDEWYALAEEIRLAIPDLASLIGAV